MGADHAEGAADGGCLLHVPEHARMGHCTDLDVLILMIGTFIDVSPAILLLTPILLPVMVQYGFSPLQFGAMMLSLIHILFPVVDHTALYCVALAVGSVLGAVILSLLKKNRTDAE